MFGIVLALVLPFGLLFAIRRIPQALRDPNLTWIVLVAYAARLAVSTVIKDLSIFSYGTGGDSDTYEYWAAIIAKMWNSTGVHYMTGAEIPSLQETSLPQNLYAFIDYTNGEPTHLGCAAVVAAVACIACINIYSIAVEIGARPNVVLAMVALMLFTPSYFYHTADAYKDGFVVVFEFGALGAALRLARRFSFATLGVGLACLGGLWLTRYYLVYAMVVPLMLGALGMLSRSAARTAIGGLLVVAALVGGAAYTRGADALAENANTTLYRATSDEAIADNAQGGSGVTFETQSPYGALAPKMAYALLAPFPWERGSIALQVAKLEVLIWYYLLIRALRAMPRLWRSHRTDLLIFLTFVGPVSLMYALSFSNIGLVLRQRMGLVMAMEILATLSWGRRGEKGAGYQPAPPVPSPAAS